MEIKVLGPGCAKCEQAEELVRKVTAELGLEAKIEKITDLKTMMQLGVLSTPAIIINGQIKCTGRVPGREELASWLS